MIGYAGNTEEEKKKEEDRDEVRQQPKGLTLTIIFEAESANYGESVGNVASLKKVARNNGEQYFYISRQAIRYNLMEQIGEPLAEVSAEGKRREESYSI